MTFFTPLITDKNSSGRGVISLNNVPKITTIYDENGHASSNYSMSPWEQLAYDYAQREFAKNIDKVNVFSEETLKSLNNQIDAYTKCGIKKNRRDLFAYD